MGHAPLPSSERPPSAPIPAPPGAAAYLTDLEPPVRAQVRRTMHLTILEGSFTQVFLNWTTGSVLVGFMLHLGAAPTELALVSAAPHLSQLASPFAAYVAALLGRRKVLTAAMALGSRLTWLLAAALPMFALPDDARPWALIGLVLLASFFLAAHNTLWTAWMGDVVPERERGRAFGLRTGVMGVVGTGANLAAGVFLDRVGAPLSFQVVLLVAVVAGLAGAGVVLQQIDPPTAAERVRWRQLLTLPWRDRGFRRLLRFTAYWNFVVMLSGPFVTPFYLQELGMTFTQVAFASTITALTALVTTSLWGRVTDRVGHKRVLMLGTLPRANRVVFIAMLGLATGLSGFLGGSLAGPLLVALQGVDATVLGARPSGYVWLFAVALVLRTQAWWWLRPVPDDGAGRPGLLLRGRRTSLRGRWRGFSRRRRRS